MASKIVKKSIEDYKELEVIQPIELCILDFQMPRLNGIEFVKLFRNFIRNNNMQSPVKILEPRFVFLTAYMTLQFKNHLKQIDIEQVYEKPLEISVLDQIIDDSLEIQKPRPDEEAKQF